MQSMFEAQVARESRNAGGASGQQPEPPVIPPLSFDNVFSTLYDGPPPHQDNSNVFRRARQDSLPRRSHTRFRPLAEEIVWGDSDDDGLPLPPLDRRPSSSSSRTRDGVPESSRRLLSYLSGTSRFEESRLDTRESNREAADRDTDHAIELLRHDGPTLSRTQEIVNRFRRQREQHAASEVRNGGTSANTNPYRHWGDIEQSEQRRNHTDEERPWATRDRKSVV